MAKAAATAKIPFGTKLKAWWEGYDADEYHAKLSGGHPAPAAEPERKEPVAPLPATPLQGEKPKPGAIDPWVPPRADVVQLIWGDGYCGPGGPEQVVAASKLLGLNAEMSLLQMGAGLGGPARALASEFGVWVSAYEASPALVAHGNHLSAKAGLAKKAELLEIDPHSNAPFQRHFDRAILDGFLGHVPSAESWLGTIYDALKPDGLMLITDLFLGDADRTDPRVLDWLAHEPAQVTIESVDLLLQSLKKAGFSVRVNDDLSDEYTTQIQKAWGMAAHVVGQLMADPDQRSNARILLAEAELWNRRISLLKDGVITQRRLLAQKK
jgi:SAM-dependent methyltransferase